MSEAKAKVLIVDDEVENVNFVRRVLGRKYDLATAADGQEALEQVRRAQFAVIISDQRMPSMSGVQFLAAARRIAPESIRIILTGFADLDETIDAINLAGVSSFIRKPVKPAEIEQTVASALEIYSLRFKNQSLLRSLEERNRQLEEKERLLLLDLDEKSKELLITNKRLEEMVVRDGLTGLYNHRFFQERAEQEVRRAERYHLNLSLVFFDLDHFKTYNDLNGHPQGDQALLSVANILQHGSRAPDVVARVRGTDIVARYGGEEFVILLPETNANGAEIMAERLRQAIEAFAFPGEERIPGERLTVSGGIASYPADARSRGELIERADMALYRAKAAGRNRVCLFGADTAAMA